MTINTITLSDFVRLADFKWEEGLKSVKRTARDSGIFRESVFPAGTGDTREYNEIDSEEYSKKKDEGDQATVARVQEGYSKILTLKRFGLDIDVTWEMRRRNKYADVLTSITNLAKQQAMAGSID